VVRSRIAKVKRKSPERLPMSTLAHAPVPRLSRDELESLLYHRKLDHTLTSALPPSPAEARWVVPTGIAELDARLRGGLPRGHLSEIVGARSSGRLAVGLSALAAATARGEAVAFIDPLDMFDPASAAAAFRHGPGIDFSRMLWVRGEPTSSSRVSLSCEYGTLQKSLDRAVKAVNLILQAGGFGLVVLDLTEMGPQVLRRLPFTTWLRLHRVIEGSETACVLMGSEPIARSAGGVCIQLASGQVHSINARVVRSRAMETDRDVCVPLSAAAC
jgi:recombination protein RecA